MSDDEQIRSAVNDAMMESNPILFGFVQMHKMFLQAVEAGFTETQAIQLVVRLAMHREGE